jgi:hypothetical protein
MDGQEDVDSDTEERGSGGDDAETTADVKEWISASAAGDDAAVTEEGLAATVNDAGAPFAMARVQGLAKHQAVVAARGEIVATTMQGMGVEEGIHRRRHPRIEAA